MSSNRSLEKQTDVLFIEEKWLKSQILRSCCKEKGNKPLSMPRIYKIWKKAALNSSKENLFKKYEYSLTVKLIK